MVFGIRKVCFALCLGLVLTGPVTAMAAEDEPDIQIRYGEDKTIYEYKVNGEIVEIKIVPKVGPEYYLVRTEEGDFQRSETSRLLFPSWKLIEW